jgi:hypothetical protein
MILNRDTNLYDLCARRALTDRPRRTPQGSVEILTGVARPRGKRKSAALLRTIACGVGQHYSPENDVRLRI